MLTPKPANDEAARSLNRQLILEEDEYTTALSHIIARDFFPSLLDLEPEPLNISVQGGTPYHPDPGVLGETPYEITSETPLRTPRGEPPCKRTRYDTNMSLDSFQARYTSEDNSSFTQILDEENRQRREKWGWAWAVQKKVEEQRDRMLEGREIGLIEVAPAPGVRERRLINAPTLAGLITASEPESTHVPMEEVKGEVVALEKKLELVVKDNTPMGPVDVMAPRKDTRSAGVDAWKFKTRNSLMFPPDADISPYAASSSAAENLKVIKYTSTRLREQSETRPRCLSAPPSPTRSRIEAAITDTPYRARTPDGGYNLVPNIPSPTPSEIGPQAVKQLMTWGTLNATPRILSQSDGPAGLLPTPSTPFHLPAPSTREALSHQLSARASKSLRAKAGLLGLAVGRTPTIPGTPASRKNRSMAPPSWTPRRADAPGNLTPAARRLLDRTSMGTAAARRAEATRRTSGWESSKGGDASLNRVRWTPTPNGPRS